MKSVSPSQKVKEVELKLLLVTSNPQSLFKQLAASSPLRHVAPVKHQLHSVYYDTPDQWLRQQRAVLRIRRVGSADQAVWIQTLKTGASGGSALSARGEWETEVAADTPNLQALRATPWEKLDPDGHLFGTLSACFATGFKRTCWTISTADGSEIEVALDLGQVQSGDRCAEICELELELLKGNAAALFDVAQQLATSVALLPAGQSKAERGFALSNGTLDQACFAQPPKLQADATLLATAQTVLREMFFQFTVNLDALRRSDDVEVVHQARVGWRRFKSALRLFRASMPGVAVPPLAALQPLLDALGALRNLDVALHDTLAPLAPSYIAADAQRALAWDALLRALTLAAQSQRTQVRQALLQPAAGAALLAITRFIEELTQSPALAPDAAGVVPLAAAQDLQHWAGRRVRRFRRRLKLAQANASTLETQHRVRILAKRLRYAAEVLRSYLPKRRVMRWIDTATRLQSTLGASRDIHQAYDLACQHTADAGLLEFLRGYRCARDARG